MSIFDLFKEQHFFKINRQVAKSGQDKLPALFSKCEKCKEPVENDTWKQNFNICPYCSFHRPISCEDRISLVYDDGKCALLDSDLSSVDILGFSDRKSYQDRLKRYRDEGKRHDAFVSTHGKLRGREICMGFFDFQVLGGSMGSVVGEKVCRLFEFANRHEIPVVIFHQTGGARMQEGLFSLFQMGKTSAVLSHFKKTSALPYISVMCYPTTGGVAASFAMAGDVNLAEKDALVGFAGRRVIEQAIKRATPQGFQTADYVFDKGMVDNVVHRLELRDVLAKLIRLLTKS